MIINSFLDNDMYKYTMMQAVLHQHPGAIVKYQFKCRTPNVDFRPYSGDIIKNVNRMCNELRFRTDELDYMKSLRFIKDDFVQFLKLFRFNYDYVTIRVSNNGELHITIEGPWLHTILFEVPILSIVSEVYSREMSNNFEYANAMTRRKAKFVKEFNKIKNLLLLFAEFGGRRRHSLEAQRNALKIFMEVCPESLIGTSNLMLAKELGIKPIGTMAHEWLQAHQALCRIADSQFMAFENWAKEYRGDLGVALSDVIGLKYFLHDFDMYFSKLFDGTRQDSGYPENYAYEMIRHYEKMGIDPKTKTIVFSDGLNFDKAAELLMQFHSKINCSFGIGTHITNDFDFKALQLVLKMVECNGQPVAKKSDSPGKGMCNDDSYVNYMMSAFNRRINN